MERGQFLNLLRASFEFCEEARKDGRVMAYGLATWDSLRVPPEHKLYFSLQDAVKLAEDVGGSEHGFRAIQLPVNAHMREAWEQNWQLMDTIGAEKEQISVKDAASKVSYI